MLLSNIFLVGLYVSLIIIVLYCYWAYVYYRHSSTRVGLRATSKYYNEMVQLDPSKKKWRVQKASVAISPDKTSATVKFNIYQDEPYKPVGGVIRKYNLVKEQKYCPTQMDEIREDSSKCQGILSNYQKNTLGCSPWKKGLGEKCQGLLNDELQQECIKEVYSGLGCLWL